MSETKAPIDFKKILTHKQLGMVRRGFNIQGKDADIESLKRFNCLAGELTKQQASELIKEIEAK